MSALGRFRQAALIALLAAGLTLAATATGAQAATVGRAGGLRLTSCPGDIPTDVGLFRHGIACRRAFKLAESAANADRHCPAGWRERKRVRMKGVNPAHSGYPALTMCSRRAPRKSRTRRQAFTYFLPTG